MTSRIEIRIATLGAIDDAAAARIAVGARERLGPLPSAAPTRNVRILTPGRAALAGALLLTVVAALALALRPGGADSANAALLRRVALAITPPPHTIQHIVTVVHQGSWNMTLESWQSVDNPFTYRWRQATGTTCGGTFRAEYSSTLDERQWLDADHNRILRTPLVPAKERAGVPAGGARAQFDVTVSFAFGLKRGDAHVAGTTTMDGKPVTQISWPTDLAHDPASRNLLYVETATGIPVALQWGGGKLDATGGIVAQQTFPAYEFLPESSAAANELSEHDAHPDLPVAPLMTEREFSTHTQEAQRLHCGGVG